MELTEKVSTGRLWYLASGQLATVATVLWYFVTTLEIPGRISSSSLSRSGSTGVYLLPPFTFIEIAVENQERPLSKTAHNTMMSTIYTIYYIHLYRDRGREPTYREQRPLSKTILWCLLSDVKRWRTWIFCYKQMAVTCQQSDLCECQST